MSRPKDRQSTCICPESARRGFIIDTSTGKKITSFFSVAYYLPNTNKRQAKRQHGQTDNINKRSMNFDTTNLTAYFCGCHEKPEPQLRKASVVCSHALLLSSLLSSSSSLSCRCRPHTKNSSINSDDFPPLRSNSGSQTHMGSSMRTDTQNKTTIYSHNINNNNAIFRMVCIQTCFWHFTCARVQSSATAPQYAWVLRRFRLHRMSDRNKMFTL